MKTELFNQTAEKKALISEEKREKEEAEGKGDNQGIKSMCMERK